MEQINSTVRPSGIPRPTSRLPVLSKRSSVLITKPSQDELQPQVAANNTPRLAKRTSIASLPNNAQARPASRPAPRAPSTGTSRTRPAIRSTSSKSSLSSLNRTNSLTATYQSDEDFDRVSSLDAFRASSRQSSYDDVDSSITADKVRKSRPSLSDRAMESIQSVPTTPKDRRQSNFFVSDSPMGPPPRPSSVMSNSNSTTSRPGTSDGTFLKPAPPSSVKMPMSAKPAAKTAGNGFGYSQSGRRTSSLTAKLQNARSTPRPQDNDTPVTARKVSAPRPAATTNNSSSALRQQIAAAKAAAKKEREAALHDSPREGQDVEVHDDFTSDPFNQAPKDGKHILRNRIRTARLDGRLNIAAMQLHEMPEEVMTMYSTASIEQSNISWAELVDLTRFIASDNEFESIADTVFPDLSPEELEQNEDAQAGQFGGIEMLDLHNNILTSVPAGLRRLERLTSLNLTHNRLENGSLEIIAQIKSLRELKLGHNSISGTLPTALCSLHSLETLELQSNRLLALPEAISGLSRLKALNVSANQLTSLPMDALSHLPLQELDASSNALIASLFPLGGVSEHKTLRILNLANNSIAALTFSPELLMPELQTLDVTNNHLAVLPPVTSWTKLAVLYAGDNKLPELPEGFTKLEHLRIANLSGNELHLVPAEIALMESLTTLVLASNPLRQKKYLTMSAADIKQDLRSFLNQTPEEYDDEVASWGTAPEAPSHTSGWTLKSGGLLDLANKGLTDAINDTLSAFLGANEVKQLHLQGNKLTVLPPALFLGQDLRSLDLSNNPLEADYLSDNIELPSLVELSLSSCRISSLEPLLTHLRAANLHILQINGNRLAGLVPDLHEPYPLLLTLLASDNKFDTVTFDVLRGYNTVDLTSNELQSLPAEIGMLWEEGLKSFEVGRNAFRVPGHRVLEKGTQATMRWLRDRIKVDSTDGATDESLY